MSDEWYLRRTHDETRELDLYLWTDLSTCLPQFSQEISALLPFLSLKFYTFSTILQNETIYLFVLSQSPMTYVACRAKLKNICTILYASSIRRENFQAQNLDPDVQKPACDVYCFI